MCVCAKIAFGWTKKNNQKNRKKYDKDKHLNGFDNLNSFFFVQIFLVYKKKWQSNDYDDDDDEIWFKHVAKIDWCEY